MGKSLSLLKDGTHGSYESVQQGAWLLSAKNIINNRVVITSNDRKISENDFKKIHDKFQLRKGDVLLTIVGTIGRSAILKEANKLTFQRSVAYLRPDENILTSSNFLFSLSKSSNFQNQLKKRTVISAQPGIYLSDIDKLNITIPELKEEQDKIASIIITIDNILSLQQRKLEQLKQLKKAMLQQLFVDKNNKQPTLRFKNFKGDWKQHRLGEISTKVTTKNQSNASLPVFTNSAKDGIVNQEKFFDKQIANNTSNYYVVNNNDFVYNPRISKNAPFGPIRRNTLNKTGIMSPLYYIFSLSHNTDENFLSFYFLSSKWYKFMYENGDSGARSDRFAIKDKVFQQMPIKLPLIIEQTEIGKFLNYVNILISLQQTKLTQLTTLKKYLLQKMFI